MKNLTGSVMGIAMIAIIASGCADNTPPITSGIDTNTMTHGDDFSKHLHVHNPELGKKLAITDVKSRQTNGLLELNVELTSSYNKSQKLQYQFNWFDAQGFVIESRKSAWKPLELHGFQSSVLRGVAPSEQATSFNVNVREVPLKAYEY
jgi:uncharacterized protein YcfL